MRTIVCAAIAILAGIGLSSSMEELMPATPDAARGVVCALCVAAAFGYLLMIDLTKIITGD